ncbi:MAG: Fis family transcriptional regulator [Leptolyngbyaceae cyanobacterium MO_188.B28]|nr:Fis family transcriptional regulator [Leptolyngbyaceae cyanobacterium MO_188.B28]
MEPLSVLAGAITTCIVPKALETIGEKMGEATLEKSRETIQLIRQIVQEKLKTTNTDGILTLAEIDPTETNIEVLKAVLLGQITSDSEFATQLQKLLNHIQTQTPSLQVVLSEVRIKGSAELGNIRQASEGHISQQIVGQNLGVGGDFKAGDIIQDIQNI